MLKESTGPRNLASGQMSAEKEAAAAAGFGHHHSATVALRKVKRTGPGTGTRPGGLVCSICGAGHRESFCPVPIDDELPGPMGACRNGFHHTPAGPYQGEAEVRVIPGDVLGDELAQLELLAHHRGRKPKVAPRTARLMMEIYGLGFEADESVEDFRGLRDRNGARTR